MSIGHRNKQKKGQEFVPMKVPGDKIAVPPTLMVHPITCPIELPSVSIVACGEYHTLAVCQDGTLWSWGRNQCGQLGHGDKKENKYKTPTQIIALAKKICIKAAAGGQHSMVLTDANKIYSWGLNNFGQLGIGNMDDHDLPRPDIIPSLRRWPQP
jgi:alpha-tubulin suppressor-like RCC1 family protein